jgi:hypothetical protein
MSNSTSKDSIYDDQHSKLKRQTCKTMGTDMLLEMKHVSNLIRHSILNNDFRTLLKISRQVLITETIPFIHLPIMAVQNIQSMQDLEYSKRSVRIEL